MTPNVPLVATRHLINTYYPKTDGDDFTFIVSSMGNEHLYKVHADKIGSDVIATMTVNYMHFTPMLDSCDDVCGTTVK